MPFLRVKMVKRGRVDCPVQADSLDFNSRSGQSLMKILRIFLERSKELSLAESSLSNLLADPRPIWFISSHGLVGSD